MSEIDLVELAQKLHLTEAEYELIIRKLGREPNYTELGIFSAMWNEHCSYKSSLVHLRKFPRHSNRALTEMGKENAGVLKLNDKWAIAFKIESHNHPSAIEPFQGAATGVGGILRDVFCMGAYPIATLDSLHFGELSDPITRHLFDGVVRGIASYGNCFGVPTVAGEVHFDRAYSGNPLVNVMAVGIVEIDKIVSACARGVGNPVIYIGSATGRDGIHGASFASAELTEESSKDRPSVQIGDPFTEKLLMEATQEMVKKGLIVGMQDMGAAGLTSSSAEMAAKGGVGIELNLDLVPLREENMTPFEIMLSESQERMLLVATEENVSEIEKILQKWQLHYAKIGKVISEPVLRLYWHGEVNAEVPVNLLQAGDGAPVYNLPYERPKWLDEVNNRNPLLEYNSCFKGNIPAQYILPEILRNPTVASKKWVYRQYDHQVGIRTVIAPGNGDAALIRIMETGQFVALTTDCNGAYCYLDPYSGAAIAVLEAARNVVSVGAIPIGITDCLNFGNPQKKAVMWQFAKAVEGISDACLALGIPVTGGNVSFYNESPQGAIYPTPVIGMVGLLEHKEHITPMGFRSPGDIIMILGNISPEDIGGSQLQMLLWNEYFGMPPAPRISEHVAILDFIVQQISYGKIRSCHDVSEGGVAVAIAECAIEGGLGANIKIPEEIDPILWLFSESQGVFVITVAPENAEELASRARKLGIPCRIIGRAASGKTLAIGDYYWDMDELVDCYESMIPAVMGF